MSIEFQAFWEAVIGVLLLVGAAVLVVTNSYKQVREIYIFAGVLVLESLPFLSAVAIAHSGELAASTPSPSGATARCGRRN